MPAACVLAGRARLDAKWRAAMPAFLVVTDECGAFGAGSWRCFAA